jgi:hypothetical protein
MPSLSKQEDCTVGSQGAILALRQAQDEEPDILRPSLRAQRSNPEMAAEPPSPDWIATALRAAQ